MQSTSGRGPGAALGIIAVIFVGVGTYISHVIIERSKKLREPNAIIFEGGNT